MSETQQISVHTSNGWETLKVPYKANSQNNAKSLSSPLNQYEWFNLAPGTGNLQNSDYYRSIAYACINARAEKVNTAILHLQKELANGKMKDINVHPFWNLISNPNAYQQSFKELIYLVSISLDLYPQGAFLYYPKNRLEMPVELYHLPSKNVSFELTPDNTMIQRYRFSNGSKLVYYNPDEIIHFKIPNPDNPFFSKNTAGAASLTLDAELYQLLYQKNFYLNDAAIGGVFSAPGKLSDDSYNRLNGQIKQKYQNPENAGKYFLAEDGLEYKPGTATPREADYSKSHIDTRNEVCGLFRVPKSILGFTDDVNRANGEASNRSFLTNTIIPFSFHIWDKLEQFIKLNYDDTLWLVPKYDMEEPYELLTKDFSEGYKKWYRPNEIRARRGLPEDWTAEDESVNNNQKVNENPTAQ